MRGLRTVLRHARRQPITFTVSLVGATAYALASVASTVVLGRVTNEALAPAFDGGVERSVLVLAAVAIWVVALIRGGSIVLRRYFAALTTFGTQARLRRQVTDHYLDVPLSFHRARPTGELLARADADVLASTEVLNALPFSVGVLVLVVVAVVSLAMVDPLLMVVALLLFPTLAAINRLYTNRIHRPVAVVQSRIADVSSIAHESFDGALTVKTLGRAEAEVERLDEAAARLQESRIDVGRIRSVFEPIIDALPNVGTIVLLVVGAWQINAGNLDIGGLVQAMALFALLAMPMRITGFFLQELPRAVVASERLEAVLAEPVAHRPEARHERPLPSGPLPVSFEDVSFRYEDSEEVLHDVSVEVAAGEVVALVGATGSGKTTLCELLVRADDPTAGSVRVGGVDLRDVQPGELRRAVALVFQEAFLFGATVRENVTLGAVAGDGEAAASAVSNDGAARQAPLVLGDDEVWQALRVAHADGFVAALPGGLDAVVGERGVTLSGGQRQRIALARALVRHPRVLVLDDATSAVDPVVEARILEDLRSALDMTTLLVAHRLSTIALADRVVFLRDGRVEASGSHSELLALESYAAIARAYEQGEVA